MATGVFSTFAVTTSGRLETLARGALPHAGRTDFVYVFRVGLELLDSAPLLATRDLVVSGLAIGVVRFVDW